MNRIAGRESEIKRSLYLFISHYIPCANLHLIDNIVLSYIASILEEAANDSSFGIGDFMEMMTAYYPDFSRIKESAVYSWLLDLEAALQGRSITHSEKWSRVYRIQEDKMAKIVQPNYMNLKNDNILNAKTAPQIPVNILPFPPSVAQGSSVANADPSAAYRRDQNGYNNKVAYGQIDGGFNGRSHEENINIGMADWRARTDTNNVVSNEIAYCYQRGMSSENGMTGVAHAPNNVIFNGQIYANKTEIVNVPTYSYQNSVVDTTPYGYDATIDQNNGGYDLNNRSTNGQNCLNDNRTSQGGYNHNNGMAKGTNGTDIYCSTESRNGTYTGRQNRYKNGTAKVNNLTSYGYNENMSNGKNGVTNRYSNGMNNGIPNTGYTKGAAKEDRKGGYGYNNRSNYVTNEKWTNDDCYQSNGDYYGRANADSYSESNGDSYSNISGDIYGQANGDSYNISCDSCDSENSDSYGKVKEDGYEKPNVLRYKRLNGTGSGSRHHLSADDYGKESGHSFAYGNVNSHKKAYGDKYENSGESYEDNYNQFCGDRYSKNSEISRGHNYVEDSGNNYSHNSKKSYDRINGERYEESSGKSYEDYYGKDSGDSYSKDNGDSVSRTDEDSYGKIDVSYVDYYEALNTEHLEKINNENNEEDSAENNDIIDEKKSNTGSKIITKPNKDLANEESNVFYKENKRGVVEDKKDVSDGGAAEKKSISLLSLVDMLPKPTRESKNIDIWEGGVPRKSRRNKHSSSSESESSQEHHMDKFSFHKQCEQLRDIFPQTCELELKHCLTITNGDVEQATLTLLNRQEMGVCLTTATTAPPKPRIDDDEIKKRVIARYSFVDKNAETKEHRPVAPKNEPKKLVRYRDNKIVSLKGERYTEVSKSGHDDDQLRKPKKTHCP